MFQIASLRKFVSRFVLLPFEFVLAVFSLPAYQGVSGLNLMIYSTRGSMVINDMLLVSTSSATGVETTGNPPYIPEYRCHGAFCMWFSSYAIGSVHINDELYSHTIAEWFIFGATETRVTYRRSPYYDGVAADMLSEYVRIQYTAKPSSFNIRLYIALLISLQI